MTREHELEKLLREARAALAFWPFYEALLARIDAALSGAPLRHYVGRHPFMAACGADEPNQSTTEIASEVTCDACRQFTDQGAPEARGPVGPPLSTKSVASPAAAAPEAGSGGWAGELGRCDTTQEPHSHRGRLCSNWRPLNPAPSPRPPEPEGGE